MKAKAQQLEYFSGEESTSKKSDQQSDSKSRKELNTSEEETKDGRTIAQLTTAERAITSKWQCIVAMINTRAMHYFIYEMFVTKRGLQTEEYDGFKVMVASGYKLPCTCKISTLSIQLGYHELKDELYVVDMGNNDVILGMTWMLSLVEFSFNL